MINLAFESERMAILKGKFIGKDIGLAYAAAVRRPRGKNPSEGKSGNVRIYRGIVSDLLPGSESNDSERNAAVFVILRP